jgi:hypothetical protein
MMLERFFEDNPKLFPDYNARHIWAADLVLNCKFVWAVTEVIPTCDTGISISLIHAPA